MKNKKVIAIDETAMKLSISISRYTYETLNLDLVKNKSRYIERLVLLGLENEMGEDLSLKSKFSQALIKIRELKKEKDKLSASLSLLKKSIEEKQKKDRVLKWID